MIEIKNLSKSFNIDDSEVKAVKNANLKIDDGEIFGVIGYSGAGKSTLVRCINLLEKPTQGSVIIDDVDITKINQKQLRALRKKIGMIFQQFNLLSNLTVAENIAFNLKGQQLTKKFIKDKVEELLDFVGISDKKDVYPSQLSGGQKQRVAIARALANNPKILLCDEATSALDPQTTNQILDLLKKLNKSLGITIFIITHEMQVIKSICDRVAVMENGNVVESGSVFEVFSNPKADITKEFIKSTNILNQVKENLILNDELIKIDKDQVLIKLDFVGQRTREAVIYEVSKNCDVSFNIAFGNMDLIQNQIIGSLIIILSGNKDSRENAICEFERRGIKVEVLK